MPKKAQKAQKVAVLSDSDDDEDFNIKVKMKKGRKIAIQSDSDDDDDFTSKPTKSKGKITSIYFRSKLHNLSMMIVISRNISTFLSF